MGIGNVYQSHMMFLNYKQDLQSILARSLDSELVKIERVDIKENKNRIL